MLKSKSLSVRRPSVRSVGTLALARITNDSTQMKQTGVNTRNRVNGRQYADSSASIRQLASFSTGESFDDVQRITYILTRRLFDSRIFDLKPVRVSRRNEKWTLGRR